MSHLIILRLGSMSLICLTSFSDVKAPGLFAGLCSDAGLLTLGATVGDRLVLWTSPGDNRKVFGDISKNEKAISFVILFCRCRSSQINEFNNFRGPSLALLMWHDVNDDSAELIWAIPL